MFLTNFDEFLFIDYDNNVVRDPTYLFDYMKFKKVTALFYPDIWPLYKENPFWNYFNGGP